jgi:hypothetical protein
MPAEGQKLTLRTPLTDTEHRTFFAVGAGLKSGRKCDRSMSIALITLTASARAVEENEVPTAPVVAPAIVPIDTTPIEAPPLPRPRPALRDAISDNPAALISAFRHQHGEGPVAISGALIALRRSKRTPWRDATCSITMR